MLKPGSFLVIRGMKSSGKKEAETKEAVREEVKFEKSSSSANDFAFGGSNNDPAENILDDIANLIISRESKKDKGKSKKKLKSKVNAAPSVQSLASFGEPTSSETIQTPVDSKWSKLEALPSHYLEFSKASSKTSNAFLSDDDTESNASSSDTQPARSSGYSHELELLKEYQKSNPCSLSRIDSDDELPVQSKGKGKKKPTLNTSDLGSEEWGNEKYEVVEPKFFTDHFKRFQAALTNDPEQILRYQLNGRPVWFAEPEKKDFKCTCGASKRFEFQLMPNLLNVLPLEELAQKQIKMEDMQGNKKDLSRFLALNALGMDFATVVVFTCSRDCHQDQGVSFHFEDVIVQVDSLM